MRFSLEMLRCIWSGRRIQRYLDADPSAPLTPHAERKLKAHLSVCEYCAQACEEQRSLKQTLSKWSRPRSEQELAKLRAWVDAMIDKESG